MGQPQKHWRNGFGPWKLRPQEVRLLDALLAHPTEGAAAAALGIAPVLAFRRLTSVRERMRLAEGWRPTDATLPVIRRLWGLQRACNF